MAYYAPAKKTLRRPRRCPYCGARQVRKTEYRDGSITLDCYGCWAVLQEREQDLALGAI